VRQRLRTKPDLTVTSPAHLEALAKGDEHYRMWSRNVADKFKDKSEEEIKQILQRTGYPFAVCFEHWIGDFNMGTGVRNANAFNAKEVFYVGDKKWDRRSAVGVHNYTDVQWIPTVEEFAKLKERYVIVGVDNIPGSVSISSYHWERNTLMVFGEEGTGLTPEMQSLCRDVVHIDMMGTVRSLNCGTASGIAMFHYIDYQRRLSDAVERAEYR
jgi:tRNA G18 (ribose-2'-O)-methylase SpoU